MSTLSLALVMMARGGDTVQREVKLVSQAVTREGRNMATAWKAAGRQMSAVGKDMLRLGAMVGGVGMFRGVIADVAEFERGLTEMGITADLSAREIASIRKQLLTLAKTDLQLPEEQLSGFQQMVAAGIDPRVAIRGMHAINRAATATFSQVGDIAATTIDLYQKMDLAPEKWGRGFDILSRSGKEGKFELKDMARYIPTVASDMQRFGIVGEEGLARMGAMLQIARRGTALPSEAATNMQNFFGHITQYAKDFKKIGIDIWKFFDPKSGKIRAGKNIDDFFQEIIKKSGGSMAKLEMAGIRDIQAKQFIQQMMQNWNDQTIDGERVKGYKSIRDASLGASGDVDAGFKKVEDTTWAKFRQAEIEKSAAVKSGGSSWLAEKAGQVTAWGAEHPFATAGIAAGGYAALRLLKGRFAMRNGGAGGGTGGIGGGIPVHVTNMPNSGMGAPSPGDLHKKSGGLFGSPQAKTAGWWARQGALARLAGMGRVGATLAGSVGAAGAGTVVASSLAAGAVGYGIGTLIEKHFIKGAIGEAIYDLLHPSEKQGTEKKNDIKIDIQIDGQGRVITSTNGMNNSVNTMKRGSFFDAITAVPAGS